MGFRENKFTQLNIEDCLLISNDQRDYMDKHWPGKFYREVFSYIDEEPFKVLYTDNPNSRPNIPVNVLFGASILQQMHHLTDEQLFESVAFDQRFKYALGISMKQDFPFSLKTFRRFRYRCAEYYTQHNVDLIHDAVVSLAKQIQKYVGISDGCVRMDSLMIEANIRILSRMELLYTCAKNMLKAMAKEGSVIPENLKHYLDPNDYNRISYYDKDTSSKKKFQTIVDEAVAVYVMAKKDFASTKEFEDLERALREQTKPSGDDDPSGNGKDVKRVPKDSSDDMNSEMMQNPSDREATFRKKAGKNHRGYVGHFEETTDENGSIITEYDCAPNNKSDIQFMRERLEKRTPDDKHEINICDGAYSSVEIQEKAAEVNVEIIATNMTGRKVSKVIADFKIDDTDVDDPIVECPTGNKSLSAVKYKNGLWRIKFKRSACEGCPHCKECRAKLQKDSAVVMFSETSYKRACELKKHSQNPERYHFCARVRNGVETVPSLLRRQYHIDKLPFRGHVQTKQRMGLCIAAINFKKLLRHDKNLLKCRAYM